MLKYGRYMRKSDDDKSVTEKSLGDQKAELEILKERDSLKVVWSKGESKSARKPGMRPDYDELIELIEKSTINAILCWHINRLVRNMEEGGKLVQLFIDGKIQEIKTPHATYKTGDNILPLVLEAAQATQFSIDHTHVVNRGMGTKFEKGGCNYKVPQGYMNARHPLNLKVGIVKKDPQRYELIRKAWEMFLTGAYNPPQVIRTLNEVWGYRTRPTKKLPSSKLDENYGYKLFSNPFYLGYVVQHGKLVKSLEIEPMVTPGEFAQAQELLGKAMKQSVHTHEYPYTGLMVCGYCGKQITAEKKKISTGVLWENYHCSDPDNSCTKKGMARSKVENSVIAGLSSITVDADLCKISLENIIRDLDTQTGKVQSLYEQQNNTLEGIEKKLNNLTDMWISGLMRDEKIYKEKEAEILAERDSLLFKTEDSREELEKMRANAMAASNYIVFARDNFMAADDKRKRAIAHALGVKYVFYGKEKEIALELHPLLIEVVKFSEEVAARLELKENGLESTQKSRSRERLLCGGPKYNLLELPSTLIDALKTCTFPIFPLREMYS